MDPVTLAEVGLFVGEYVYHRVQEHYAHKPKPEGELQIPLIAEGSPVPMYFGRVRIRQPILAATSDSAALSTAEYPLAGFDGRDELIAANPFMYGLDMLFMLGIPFKDGVNRIHSVWAGDTKMVNRHFGLQPAIDDLVGDGGHEVPTAMEPPAGDAMLTCATGLGILEFLNGNSQQKLVSDSGALPLTYTADRLISGGQPGAGSVSPRQLETLRGYTSVFLFGGSPFGQGGVDVDSGFQGAPSFDTAANNTDFAHMLRWIVGLSPRAAAYSFETSTYPNTSLDLPAIGEEANPADVLWAIFRDVFGKLGLDYTRVDYETFRAAAETLRNEGHGYSRVFDERPKARDAVQEILRQIDGCIDEDPATGQIKLKLIRADFDPNDIPEINVDNCERIENFAAGGWTGLANKIRVTFNDRQLDYQQNSATSQNPANAVGQDAETEEVVLDYPGVCTLALAKVIAARELAALSRPLAKMTAIVDRSFWRVMDGDPIKVRWPEYGISSRVFRAAKVNRGTADAATMSIDLVEDFFYVYRFEVTDTGGLPSHPGQAVG